MKAGKASVKKAARKARADAFVMATSGGTAAGASSHNERVGIIVREHA
jgi:hypothetical protein